MGDAEIIEEQKRSQTPEVGDETPDPTAAPQAQQAQQAQQTPDVLLDVPTLHVDEIDLEVEDLRGRVSLQAEVLDLLKLNVGVDLVLGRVKLDITGVDAQALLKVRLDNLAQVIGRVLTTIDRNPQILENLTSSVGSAVDDVGSGAGRAAGDIGRGAGSGVGNVGEGAGKSAEKVGGGAGRAVEGATEDARKIAGDVSGSAGRVADEAEESGTADEDDRGDAEETDARSHKVRRGAVDRHRKAPAGADGHQGAPRRADSSRRGSATERRGGKRAAARRRAEHR
ncbi:hypothetical protein ACFO3J_33360 [Streptomyces polygonati]|uniref:Mannose-1-phosphate guanylyltransferase (GDP) n=1 Tax=Streptomyces polygonati TaxID=1617087 RepID=A0ABV8HZF8_9ACTN